MAIEVGYCGCGGDTPRGTLRAWLGKGTPLLAAPACSDIGREGGRGTVGEGRGGEGENGTYTLHTHLHTHTHTHTSSETPLSAISARAATYIQNSSNHSGHNHSTKQTPPPPSAHHPHAYFGRGDILPPPPPCLSAQ